MALPKALLCVLDDKADMVPMESQLRNAGLATASLLWSELATQPTDWMQLLPVLDDASVNAWVIVGRAESFTPDVLCRVSSLMLGFARPVPPTVAFILTDGGPMPSMPAPLANARCYRRNDPFPAKLMALRLRPAPYAALPFYCRMHLDPLIGQWIEIAPPAGTSWQGFTIGALHADVTAFGVGERNTLPRKSLLQYPQFGIRGDIGGAPFCACAAMNTLSEQQSCFMQVSGYPDGVFATGYGCGGESPEPAEERQLDVLRFI